MCNATGFAARLNASNYSSPILRNPAISLGFILKVLGAAIEMSTVLGVDADRRPLWQDRKEHLAPFPTATVVDPAAPDGGVK